MAGFTLSETTPVIGLILLLGVFICLFLLFRSRKAIDEYRNVLDSQSLPVMRIDIDRLEPTLCNKPFSQLMGYSSNAECISSFNKYPHLPQQNFYQIYRLCAEGRTPNISLQDCNGHQIQHLVSVRIDQENESMDLMLHSKISVVDSDADQDGTGRMVPVHSDSDGMNMEPSSLVKMLNPEMAVWEMDLARSLYTHNEEWLKYLGYTDDADKQQMFFWQTVTSPKDKFILMEAIGSAEGQLPFTVTYKLANRVGVELTIETRGVVESRTEEGVPHLVRGTHRDISLEQSKEAGPENDQLDGIANRHELMNQMAAILGYSELICSAENLSEETRLFASEILNSARRASKLVSPDVLVEENLDPWAEDLMPKIDFQITGGQQLPATLQTPALQSAIDHVMAFMASEGCAGSNRRLEVNHNAGSECSACATKTSDHYSSVDISTPDLTFDHSHFRNILRTGYSTTQFDSENRLQAASKIMHEHNGHLHLSTDEKGFTVKLLVTDLDKAQPVENSHKGMGGEILIVDDEVAVADFLGEIVRRAGFSTTIFNDPMAALESFKEDPARFDLVITDQSMPTLSGVDLTQAMQALRPGLPVLLCTGHREDDVAASASGASVLITKPIDVPYLLQAIRDSLKHLRA